MLSADERGPAQTCFKLQVRSKTETMLRGEKTSKTVALCAAARMGDIKPLQRASRTALNWSDDDAMTPAMWWSIKDRVELV